MSIMNRFFSSITDILSNSFHDRSKNLVAIIIVALILLYLAVGAFPVVPLENDGMRMSLGIQGINLYGDYSYTYNYASQAGIYMITGFLGKILGLESFQAFSFLTWSLSILFILITSYFLSRLLNTEFIICFLVIVSFQEVYVSGYYPNSSMVAAAFLSAALLAATWGEQLKAVVLSAILFSIAVWCRIDSVLMGAIFLFLFYKADRRYFLKLFLFGFIFLCGIVTLYFASNVSMQLFLEQFSGEVGSASDIKRTLTVYSTIFSFVAVYFSFFGLTELYKMKNWRLIILSVIAPLPLVLSYGVELDSPKKILYALTLFAIPFIIGLKTTLHWNNRATKSILLTGGLLLAVGQYIFTPAYEIMFSRSTIVYTSDEARLRGAIAYTPIYYARYRRATLIKDTIFQHKLEEYLQQNNSSYIVSQDWMTNQWLLYFLQSMNYRIVETENLAALLEDGQRIILTKGSDTVYLVRWRPETSLDLPSTLQEEIQSMPSVLYIGPDYTTTDYAQKSFLSNKFNWQRLPDWGRFEAILFQQ